MSETVDDQDLIRLVASGDRHAFTLLLGRYLEAIVKFAMRYVRQRSDAEDIAQEAFLRVWKNARQYTDMEGASVRSWIYRITYNLCIDELRRHHANTSIEQLNLVADSYYEPEQTALREAKLALLEQAMSTLNLRQHAALTLCLYEGLSNREAAASLSISVDALESLLARARRNLRKKLHME